MNKRQTTHFGSEGVWVAALVFFATGAFCGFFLTALPRLTLHDWIYWVGARIIWQLGGAIWFGAAVCVPLAEPYWKGTALGALLGLVLCFNPVLDVVRGPERWEGKITRIVIWNDQIWRRSGGYSLTVHGQVDIRGQGNAYQLELSGRQVSEWEKIFRQCHESNSTIHAVVLRHLNVVLEADCETMSDRIEKPVSSPLRFGERLNPTVGRVVARWSAGPRQQQAQGAAGKTQSAGGSGFSGA